MSFTRQTFTPDADDPLIRSADTDCQGTCYLPYFGAWMACQVLLHPFVVVGRLFVALLSCGFLSGVHLFLALARFLFVLWRW